MSSEQDLIATRKAKHLELNDGKYELAANDYYRSIFECLDNFNIYNHAVSIDPADLKHDALTKGRLTNIRKSGSISFLNIQDQSGSIQLIASKKVLANYQDLSLLDLGDIIEVFGQLCLSKTNERSILINRFTLLTKSIRPMPDKFFGLEDQEVKNRKRYLDLISSDETMARFVVRTYIIQAIRTYFNSLKFLEVETPILSTISSGANAKPFLTHHNALDTNMSLRIAPELYLKRLLVGGFEKVFEIGKNFRNEGLSTRHNPEFTMLEYYQAYVNFDKLIPQLRELISYIERCLTSHLPDNVLSFYEKWHAEHEWDLDFREITMKNAILNGAAKAEISIGESLFTEENSELFISFNNSDNERFKRISQSLHNDLANANNNGSKIAILFEALAEPFLTEDYRTNDKSSIVFITKHPKAISPLARASDDDSLYADRFEMYINGMEIANGFQELNDPVEQSLRFKEQLESSDKDPMAYDSDYIEALEYGLPPCSGVGIGLDRFCCLLTNSNNIRDVILFPTMKPLHKS